MMHCTRRWAVGPAATAEDLARMLTQSTWTLCSGFQVEGHPAYVFLNDATHEDGALEIAVVKVIGAGRWLQVESITFSWCSLEAAERHIRAALAGEYDAHDFVHKVDLVGRLDTPEQHRCHLCA